MENLTLLLVDDEPGILRAFNRLFRGSNYRLLLAGTGKEALDIMKKESVDLLISDMGMPYMNGYKLLTIVKEKYPNTIRIILSGFAEKEMTVKFIQENLAMTYLLKPWDNEEIVNTINNLLKVKQALRENHLEEMENFLSDEFDTQNNVYDELLRQIEEHVDEKVLINTIEKDVALSIMILRFVNSAFFGSNIASVEKALQYLSIEELKDIIMSEKLNLITKGDKKLDNVKSCLIKHSHLTNKITHFIYGEIIGKEIPDNYRLAGLLYNIGMLILLKLHKDEYVKLFYNYLKDGIPMVDKEKEQYGVNHQEAGGYLLNWWGIPSPIVEAASCHHSPLDSKIIHKELINTIYVAGYYGWKILGYKPPQECTDAIFSNLGTTKEACERILFDNFYNKKIEV
ncbi:MAG: HDOD domain-containing protein [Bacillota bacterium]